jgi:hypothetical protein
VSLLTYVGDDRSVGDSIAAGFTPAEPADV